MKKKKIFGVLLSLFILFGMAGILAGCDNPVTTVSNAGGKTEQYAYPEGGIIKKAFFDELKNTVNTDIYPGTVDNVNYVWTFNGADISTPMDFNIAMGLNNDVATQVQAATSSVQVQGFNFSDNPGVPGKYNLRLVLPTKWDCQSIDLYNLDGTNLNKVGTVKMDNSTETTQVNFGLTVAKGQFYLVSSTQVEGETLGTETVVLTDEEKAAAKAAGKARKQNAIDADAGYTGAMDGYNTQLDKIPSGQPGPVEPANVTIDEGTTKYCTLEVRCDNIWKAQYYPYLNPEKEPYQPKDGTIFAYKQVAYHPGEMVYDVLAREMRNAGIQMEYSYTPIYGSNYIEGINNLYEFDCGELSGWMYEANGWYPNYGCSRYLVKEGDTITWNYTCDLGADLGQHF